MIENKKIFLLLGKLQQYLQDLVKDNLFIAYMFIYYSLHYFFQKSMKKFSFLNSVKHSVRKKPKTKIPNFDIGENSK